MKHESRKTTITKEITRVADCVKVNLVNRMSIIYHDVMHRTETVTSFSF